MTSKSDPIGSGGNFSPHQIHSHEGIISTSAGERSTKPLDTKSKCAIIAFVVGGVAGIVIIGLGAANMFGPIGSAGFIGSVAGGGVVTVFAGGGIIWIAISSCQTGQGQTNQSTAAQSVTSTIESGSNTEKVRVPLKDKMGKAYPQIGQEAIDFARQKLSEHPEIKPAVFSAGWHGADKTNQPVNQEIALLTNLYWDVYFEAFTQAVKKHKDNPWSQQEVIQAADDLIKIGYAISCLTLEDLPEFIHSLEQKGTKRTYAEALATQDSYQYRTYYSCTKAYHWIRGGVTWDKVPWGEDEEDIVQPRETPKAHADLFYKKGTIQNGWRLLYNDHCDRIRSYVKEADLQRADNRHFKWTQKDEDTMFSGRTFRNVPDTLPT
jgi:hypothetical protein